MSNKLIYSFILFSIPLLEASERQLTIANKKIEANIFCSNTNKNCDYTIIDIRDPLIIGDEKLNKAQIRLFNAVEICEGFDSKLKITGIVPEKCGQVATEIDISVFIKDKCVALLKKSIEECCDIHTKNNNGSKGSFSVYFLNNNNDSDIISLCLKKAQAEIFIKKPSTTTSIKSIIVTGLGVAGFIAILIYYFNLHSKYMTLLQHS